MKVITIFTAMLIVLACVACSKEKDGNSNFNPAEFYVAGTIEGNTIDSTGYALVFRPNGIAVAVSAWETANAIYEFQNGHLKFMFEGSSEGIDFTIVNNKITNASELTHTSGLPHTYSLQKIPGTDSFKGKTFKGQLNNTGVFSASFGNDGTIEMSQVLNNITITHKANYTLQNNAVATANVKDIGSVLCIMLDGKLIFSTSNGTGSVENYTVLTPVN